MTLYHLGQAGQMSVIVIAMISPHGVVPRRYRFVRAPVVRADNTTARLIDFPGDQLAQIRSGSLSFGGMWMVSLSWHVARLGPR